MDYDPDHAPDPEAWLALGESERVAAVQASLQARGEAPPRVRAAVHAVIETQIATEDPPAARRAAERLTGEGLRRSMVLRVLTLEMILKMQQAMQAGSFDDEGYAARLDGLTAAGILAEGLGRLG